VRVVLFSVVCVCVCLSVNKSNKKRRVHHNKLSMEPVLPVYVFLLFMLFKKLVVVQETARFTSKISK